MYLLNCIFQTDVVLSTKNPVSGTLRQDRGSHGEKRFEKSAWNISSTKSLQSLQLVGELTIDLQVLKVM